MLKNKSRYQKFIIVALFSCILLANSPFAFARNRHPHYEPDVVEMSGIVDVLTFPGPPNYEDTRTGDMPETGSYLKLDYLIDVDFNPLTHNEVKKNVRVLQLVLGYKNRWPKIIPGSHVCVIGTLFAQSTGHHHTRVLMEVHKISIDSKKHYASVMNDRSLSGEFS